MKKIKSVWEDMPRKSSEMGSDDMKIDKIKAAPEVTVKKIGSSEGQLEKIKAAPKAERVGVSANKNRYKSVADLRARISELEAKDKYPNRDTLENFDTKTEGLAITSVSDLKDMIKELRQEISSKFEKKESKLSNNRIGGKFDRNIEQEK